MRWGQIISGGIFLAVAFGFLFIPTLRSVIWVCLLGNQTVTIEGYHGAVGYLSTCDEQIDRLTTGFYMPMLVVFLGLVIAGAWLLFTGLQSRSLVGMKKEA